MRSLFILSLPRSLSSITFDIARHVLSLNQPAWASAGEIANLDRFTLYNGPRGAAGVRYVQRKNNPELFESLCSFLDDVVNPFGNIYKDVVNPFVMAEWLSRHSYPVLKIRRPIADVAYSMLAHNWHYPAAIASGDCSLIERLVEGLLIAERVLETVPGITVEYTRLIEDETVLRNALAHLYPEESLPRFRFIDNEFRGESRKVLRRRETEMYEILEHAVAHKSM